MKRLGLGILLASMAGAACAADLPAPSAPYSKAPAVVGLPTNWSGFYIGAMGGYGSENTSDGLGIKGGFGGGTVGYNWQFGALVAGFEADGGFADINNSTAVDASHWRRSWTRWRRFAAASAWRSNRFCCMAPAALPWPMPNSARARSV